MHSELSLMLPKDGIKLRGPPLIGHMSALFLEDSCDLSLLFINYLLAFLNGYL